MVHRKTHGKAPITQVGVKPRQHFRTHHALVDNGAAAQGREIEVAGARSPGCPGAIANPAPQPKQQGFQRIPCEGLARGWRQEPLGHVGRALAGQRTEHRGIHRHIAPTQALEAQFGRFLFGKLNRSGPLGPIGGQKHHAQAALLALGRPSLRPNSL